MSKNVSTKLFLALGLVSLIGCGGGDRSVSEAVSGYSECGADQKGLITNMEGTLPEDLDHCEWLYRSSKADEGVPENRASDIEEWMAGYSGRACIWRNEERGFWNLDHDFLCFVPSN